MGEAENREMSAEATASRIYVQQHQEAVDALAELQEQAADHQRLSEEVLAQVSNRLQAEMAHEHEEHRAYQRRELVRRYAGGIGALPVAPRDVPGTAGEHLRRLSGGRSLD